MQEHRATPEASQNGFVFDEFGLLCDLNYVRVWYARLAYNPLYDQSHSAASGSDIEGVSGVCCDQHYQL